MDSENKKKKDLNSEDSYQIQFEDEKNKDLSNLSILIENSILNTKAEKPSDQSEITNHEIDLDDADSINLDLSDFKDIKNLEKLKIHSKPAIDNKQEEFDDKTSIKNLSNVIDFGAIQKESEANKIEEKEELNFKEVKDEDLSKLDSIEENASEIKMDSNTIQKDLKEENALNPLEDKIKELESKLLEKSQLLLKKQDELETLKEEKNKASGSESQSRLIQDLQNQLDIAQHQNKSLLKEKDKWILNLKEEINQKQKDKEHFQRQFEDLNVRFQKKKDLLSRILKAIRLIEKLIEENN